MARLSRPTSATDQRSHTHRGQPPPAEAIRPNERRPIILRYRHAFCLRPSASRAAPTPRNRITRRKQDHGSPGDRTRVHADRARLQSMARHRRPAVPRQYVIRRALQQASATARRHARFACREPTPTPYDLQQVIPRNLPGPATPRASTGTKLVLSGGAHHAEGRGEPLPSAPFSIAPAILRQRRRGQSSITCTRCGSLRIAPRTSGVS